MHSFHSWINLRPYGCVGIILDTLAADGKSTTTVWAWRFTVHHRQHNAHLQVLSCCLDWWAWLRCAECSGRCGKGDVGEGKRSAEGRAVATSAPAITIRVLVRCLLGYERICTSLIANNCTPNSERATPERSALSRARTTQWKTDRDVTR